MIIFLVVDFFIFLLLCLEGVEAPMMIIVEVLFIIILLLEVFFYYYSSLKLLCIYTPSALPKMEETITSLTILLVLKFRI